MSLSQFWFWIKHAVQPILQNSDFTNATKAKKWLTGKGG